MDETQRHTMRFLHPTLVVNPDSHPSSEARQILVSKLHCNRTFPYCRSRPLY